MLVFGIRELGSFMKTYIISKGDMIMKISGRNKLQGIVKEIVKDTVMAKVVLDYKGDEIVAVITVDSIDDLGLKVGDEVTALIKSTEVMIIK
jgi:molybdopterin-binding protein